MIIPENSTIKHKIGNKALCLIWLKENNIPTSNLKIITINDLIINYGRIAEKLILEFNKNNHKGIEKIFDEIIWDNDKVCDDFNDLETIFKNKLVSFRTSASMEDLDKNSFAGLYETFLNIPFTKENYKKYILLCFKSIFTERVFAYLKINDIKLENCDFSIIIQEMFFPKYSGVAFAQFPITNTQIVFSAGLGTNVVNGENASIFWVENSLNGDEGNIPVEFKNNNSLKEIFIKLLSYLEKIAYLKTIPQDIEWSISDKEICILQTRPITKSIDRSHYQESIFDSTNISESYSGTISPLTYSFIQFAYSKVYENFLSLVGVSRKKIEGSKDILENLLGYIKGRPYYRINNWYQMIKILPAYNYNKTFFESMLIPQKKLVENNSKNNNLLNLIANIPVIIKFSYKLLAYRNPIKKFLNDFETKHDDHKKNNLHLMSPVEIVRYYTTLKKSFLDDWKVPILNDFRLMIFHGILKMLINKNIKENPQFLLNEVISGFSNGGDFEIINEMKNMADIAKKDDYLQKLFSEKDDRKIYAEIIGNDQKNIKAFKKIFLNYINKYGGRRPDELKLESPRIDNCPEVIISLIKNYSNLPADKILGKNNDTDPINTLKNEIKKKYGVIVGLFYVLFANFIIKYTKLAIRNREIFRLKRGAVYNIARDCFLVLGEKFSQSKIIDSKNDIFFLTTDEIFNTVKNHSLEQEFKKIISSRKELINKYNLENSLPRRIKLIGMGNNAQLVSDCDDLAIQKEFSGMPTSGGIARGKVLVIREFDINADYKDKILVTHQTDPGWSLIFPLLKGIILEKGNALSHAAILSRELGIPSIVKIDNIVEKLNDNDFIELDGYNGTVKIINSII